VDGACTFNTPQEMWYTQRYVCGAFSAKAVDNCIRFDGMRVDRGVALEVLDRLQPPGLATNMTLSR